MPQQATRLAVPADTSSPEQIRQFCVQAKKQIDHLNLGILTATSGAPTDSPAFGTARFDPATDKLWIYGAGGWVSTTLT